MTPFFNFLLLLLNNGVFCFLSIRNGVVPPRAHYTCIIPTYWIEEEKSGVKANSRIAYYFQKIITLYNVYLVCLLPLCTELCLWYIR